MIEKTSKQIYPLSSEDIYIILEQLNINIQASYNQIDIEEYPHTKDVYLRCKELCKKISDYYISLSLSKIYLEKTHITMKLLEEVDRLLFKYLSIYKLSRTDINIALLSAIANVHNHLRDIEVEEIEVKKSISQEEHKNIVLKTNNNIWQYLFDCKNTIIIERLNESLATVKILIKSPEEYNKYHSLILEYLKHMYLETPSLDRKIHNMIDYIEGYKYMLRKKIDTSRYQSEFSNRIMSNISRIQAEMDLM